MAGPVSSLGTKSKLQQWILFAECKDRRGRDKEENRRRSTKQNGRRNEEEEPDQRRLKTGSFHPFLFTLFANPNSDFHISAYTIFKSRRDQYRLVDRKICRQGCLWFTRCLSRKETDSIVIKSFTDLPDMQIRNAIIINYK